MAIVQQSVTSRFVLSYDDQIGPAQQVAQALSQRIEQDFFFLRRYLPFDQGASPDFFERHLTSVIFVGAVSKAALGLSDDGAKNIPIPGAARNFKEGFFGTLWINPVGVTGQPLTPEYARFLFIAEMSEQLMSNYGWVPNDSRGEALSRALAEQFFPNAAYQPECVSLAPWVNGWLNSSPRLDYLSQNPAATPANQLLGSDTDEVGYGCGILFINYLRFQLGYSLEAICQAGGTVFKDTYARLTGRSDDPLAAMTAVLDKRFDGIFYNLLNNNPFPLSETSARRVVLAFASSAKVVPAFGRISFGIAHVSPFFLCPEEDYFYHRILQAVSNTVTASAIGFALPIFTWSLNGRELFSSSGTRDETVTFAEPDPNHPRTPRSGSGTTRFDWSYGDLNARGSQDNVLAITNESFDGVYTMDLSVSVAETIGSDPPTKVDFSLVFAGEVIRYEARYYADGAKCAQRFESEVPRLEKLVDLILVGPDPPEWPGWTQVIRAIDAIRADIREIGEENQELAVQAAKYVAGRLGVEAGLVNGAPR